MPFFPALPAVATTCPYDKLQRDLKASKGHRCPLLTAPQQPSWPSSGAASPRRAAGKAAGFTPRVPGFACVFTKLGPADEKRLSRGKGRGEELSHPNHGYRSDFPHCSAHTNSLTLRTGPNPHPLWHCTEERGLFITLGGTRACGDSKAASLGCYCFV